MVEAVVLRDVYDSDRFLGIRWWMKAWGCAYLLVMLSAALYVWL